MTRKKGKACFVQRAIFVFYMLYLIVATRQENLVTLDLRHTEF